MPLSRTVRVGGVGEGEGDPCPTSRSTARDDLGSIASSSFGVIYLRGSEMTLIAGQDCLIPSKAPCKALEWLPSFCNVPQAF